MMKKFDISRDFLTAKDFLQEEIRLFIDKTDFPAKERIVRFEQPISDIEPLTWLQKQEGDVKLFWSERDDHYEMAGIGCAAVVSGESLEDYETIFEKMGEAINPKYDNLRWYGGFRFYNNEKPYSIWRDFGSYQFVIPRIEVVRKGSETTLAVNLNYDSLCNRNGNFFQELTDKLQYDPGLTFEKRNELKSRSDIPDREGWRRNIEKSMELFQEKILEKIVLARKSVLEFGNRIDAAQIIAQMKSESSKAFHFYFQPLEGIAFIGASPELLYRRENRNIFSEAVAGTRPRSRNQSEDEQFAHELLNSPKDVHEHALVCQFVENVMNQLCKSFDKDDQIDILKSDVQHLYRKYQGILKDNFRDSQIVSALHPTPAVCGMPREKALRKICEIEEFDRGWYASPIGWIGADAAEFVVGIRSGLVHQNKLFLFSGAGIVPDSRSEQEWQELEQKISHITRLFQDGH